MRRSERPFAKALRSAREAAGVSLRDLSEWTGLSTTYLHDVEQGRRGPLGPDRIRSVCDCLGCGRKAMTAEAKRDVIERALERWGLG